MEVNLEFETHPFLKKLNLSPVVQGYRDGSPSQATGSPTLTLNPHTSNPICKIIQSSKADYETALKKAESTKSYWMGIPMPKRGEIIREIGNELRKYKTELGMLISLEMGKILSEGMGEVQESIDMCDYACGLSRSIGGKVLPSERKEHVLIERWNPLGIVGVITAFNFPNAVLAWNACIALITGNCVVWKGASSTGLVTIATADIFLRVLERHNVPNGVFVALVGPGREVGECFLDDKRINLLSFTGSTPVGRGISARVHKRFGRTILELGGNNACIVMEDADVELVIKAVFFSAIGTAGQRCTTMRRLYIHSSLYETIKTRILKAYKSLKMGDPVEKSTICGPVHTSNAVKEFTDGIIEIKKQGGKILTGGKKITSLSGYYVEPTIVEISPDAPIIKEELFVPILYIFKFDNIDQAIYYNNNVPQGLSSSMFTKNMQNVFKWIGPEGSDTGLVNVNVGTSGAEIGGAFGGEKDTGGGRESGSDSWKQYMRRSTCTINFGNSLPLSQGIDFDPKL